MFNLGDLGGILCSGVVSRQTTNNRGKKVTTVYLHRGW